MSVPARRAVDKALTRFEDAAIERSWIGSKDPRDHAEIEREYHEARADLIEKIDKFGDAKK